VFCAQVNLLPLQQQLVMKRVLEQSVPDIHEQVLAAAKSDWKSRFLLRPSSALIASGVMHHSLH
jgi:hypothetical protein